MTAAAAATTASRLLQIARARQAVMEEGRSATDVLPAGWYDGAWIARSWRRCLDAGQRPGQRVGFDVVPEQRMRRVREENQQLVAAARPVLEQLSRAIASTRIGVDLSEPCVGTTAIGAALAELHPVWLHRGEHFFDDTGCYSCAGAPLFGPDGRCVGMLDLTGIDAAERPELKHLVAQSARGIENALALALPHRLVLRLNWPGRMRGDEGDGLVCLDADGWVTASNSAAREMIAGLAGAQAQPVHCSELFAQAWEPLFDLACGSEPLPTELPLWSGLRLLAVAQPAGDARGARLPLRDVEIALIRKAVDDARGNVMQAARALGISRATVYRKLAKK